ncbi:DUF2933 domain-containing protein [Denitromonas halophila]|uniref:DUF2933 domain-containing protein n=1 Tax=Denitromonas halophila TaxID=1629404 RepID=A0A557R3H6_9RHOO|nr:DUF2933 domain-containing protein [Denitromonas halophila]TVO59719.1 DUF2933 domain-containing protein [Denitromonas halophila]
MDTANPNARHGARRPRSPARRTWWVFGGFAAIALVMLGIEHRVHLLGGLPWLFLLACPLMHVFMHGGHGHGGKDAGDEK